MSRPHHDLRVWQDAMALVKQFYRVTGEFPDSEKFGLVSQIRRAAVSVPSNIAEGAARAGKKEFHHFLMIARGSLSELDTQLRISRNLGFSADRDLLIEEIERLQPPLGALIKSQKSSITP